MNETTFMTPREELEIGVMIASELIGYIYDGILDTFEIRSALREVVAEIGNGHTDRHLAEVTTHRILHDLSGRI
jgi:S-adenosylmethionine synthetase